MGDLLEIFNLFEFKLMLRGLDILLEGLKRILDLLDIHFVFHGGS